MTKKKKLKLKILLIITGLIGIIGFFLYKNIPLTQKQADLPDGWKIFTHKIGYSFSYPTNLKIDLLEDSGTVVLRSTEYKNFNDDFEFDATITVLKNKNNLPLHDFIEKKEGVVDGKIPSETEYSATPFIRNILSFEKILIGNKPAYLFRADPCSICRGETYTTYVELSPNEILRLEIFVDKDTPKPKSYLLYDEILSTFQFEE